jgi:hypothetical protein
LGTTCYHSTYTIGKKQTKTYFPFGNPVQATSYDMIWHTYSIPIYSATSIRVFFFFFFFFGTSRVDISFLMQGNGPPPKNTTYAHAPNEAGICKGKSLKIKRLHICPPCGPGKTLQSPPSLARLSVTRPDRRRNGGRNGSSSRCIAIEEEEKEEEEEEKEGLAGDLAICRSTRVRRQKLHAGSIEGGAGTTTGQRG